MMKVNQLVPTDTKVDVNSLVGDLRAARRGLTPFDPRVIDFVADLSKTLRTAPHLRSIPAVAALSFWIRPASVNAMRQHWEAGTSDDDTRITMPRGVVFHVPPSNVDTLFVYSWLLSALMGNANVVRISSTAEGNTNGLIVAIREVLEQHPAVAPTVAFVEYGHEKAITEALSAADARVIWGGDDTVRRIRSVSLNPLASEVAFPNRYSLCALDATAINDADETALAELVRNFFNDSYWFDQLGCSSPRTVFFRGDDVAVDAAQKRFVAELETRTATEGYQSPTGAVMNKLVIAAAAAGDGATAGVEWQNPDVTVVRQPSSAGFVRDSPGAGFFAFRSGSSLTDLAPFIRREDQTLTHYGFEHADLVRFVVELNGTGIDRVVPVGRALDFDRFWDGYDLLTSFSRLVTIA